MALCIVFLWLRACCNAQPFLQGNVTIDKYISLLHSSRRVLDVPVSHCSGMHCLNNTWLYLMLACRATNA